MFKGVDTKIAGVKHMLREQAAMVRRKRTNPGHFGRLARFQQDFWLPGVFYTGKELRLVALS